MIGVYCLTAYLLGSVPSAVWYGRAVHGIDVRQHGSKNAGATNTLRVLGNKAGFIVLFLDLLKGWIATQQAVLITGADADPDLIFRYKMLLGVIAVIGHIYPVFAGFKGGKGIATLLGLCIALDYRIAGLCVLLFIAIVAVSRYISVGSMCAGIFAAILSFYFYDQNIFAHAFFIAIALMVIYTHRANIGRLRAGNENKFSFNKQKK